MARIVWYAHAIPCSVYTTSEVRGGTMDVPMGSSTQIRVPPQAIEAEKALLGAIMLRPECMHDLTDLVTADSFYVDKHRTVYRAMHDLFSKSDPIDVLSVSARLKASKDIDRIGGSSYLAELVNAVPATTNVHHYADLVQKASTLRSIIAAADKIAELGFDESRDLEEILDATEKSIYDITNAPTSHKFVSMRESLGEAWERIDHLHKSDSEQRGIPTGFKDLDNLLAGLQRSDLIILAARPSMGKTALALDMARMTAIQHGTPVGIFSLEMASQQLVDRMLASEARVDAWKLRTGKLTTDQEFEQVREAIDRLSSAPIFIDDKPANNILAMRSVARRLKREHGLGLIIVDYLQMMAPTGKHAGDSLVQQITEISRSLKTLARELDVPVLALSQLSRAVEQRGGKPRLSDLRDSGSIEQDADVVMFIHREDKMNRDAEKTNLAEILVEKHRNGPVGKIDLYFDERKASYVSIDKGGYTGVAEGGATADEW
jgi:replicative DNA helicase